MNMPHSILPSSRSCWDSTRLLMIAVAVFCLSDSGWAEGTATSKILTRVSPGTVVVDSAAARWNRSIYVAVSRITNGSVDSVPMMIRKRVPLFTLALLATVSNQSQEGEVPNFELREVGAGYAIPLEGQLTIISTDNPPAVEGMDMIGRQVLAANGRHLSELRCIGATDTMQVIDVDALFFREEQHLPMIMRHFIWVEASTGRCATCVWLLKRQADGSLHPTLDPPRWLPEGTRDERAIHVDASEFFLGMPTQDAFALMNLPPGTDLAWSPGLRQIASADRYHADSLPQLAVAINQALAPLRTEQKALR